jgi:hypothetical protein
MYVSHVLEILVLATIHGEQLASMVPLVLDVPELVSLHYISVVVDLPATFPSEWVSDIALHRLEQFIGTGKTVV